MTVLGAPVQWSHVGLNCADLARTETFYRHWFGFERARVIGEDGSADQVVFLGNGVVHLELFAGAEGGHGDPVADGPHAAGAIRHLAFQVEDVDAFVLAMGSDATATLGPLTFDDVIPGWRTVWLRDPDGVVVEVSQGYRDAPRR